MIYLENQNKLRKIVEAELRKDLMNWSLSQLIKDSSLTVEDLVKQVFKKLVKISK